MKRLKLFLWLCGLMSICYVLLDKFFLKEGSVTRIVAAVPTFRPTTPTTRKTQKNWKDIQADRAKQLQEQCQQMNLHNRDIGHLKNHMLDHIIVNDKYKVMFCYVPKVACSNFKRIFISLTDKVDMADPSDLNFWKVHTEYTYKHLTYLGKFTPDEIRYRVANYNKVIFVREPMERVLSAYRDKFTEDRPGHQTFKNIGKQIVQKFRTSTSNISGDEATFPEFVHYLNHNQLKVAAFNEHWRPISDLCFPCHVNYTFIGRYEDLNEDSANLLKLLSVDQRFAFPKREETTQKTAGVLNKFYNIVDSNQFEGLKRLYSKDQKLFSYKTPASLTEIFGTK